MSVLTEISPGRLSTIWNIVQRWKGRVFFALLDQGLFSATNFGLTIVFAISLPIEEFGRYVVIWTVALFIETIQISLVVEALPAISSRYGRRNGQRLDRAAVWITVAFGSASSAVLALVAFFFIDKLPGYAWPLLVLAAVNPLQRLHLAVKRLCYIRNRQGSAAAGALGYAAACVLGMAALLYWKVFSVGAAVALTGLGSLAAVIVIMMSGAAGIGRSRIVTVRWLAGQLWQTSRWLTPAALVSWLIASGIFPIMTAIGGPAAAGIVRSLQNMLTPIVQLNSVLYMLFLPRVADRVADMGNAYGRRFARQGTVLFTVTSLFYCALIIATAHWILPMVYRKPEIAAASFLLWPLSIGIVLEAARSGSTITLLATKRTRITFVARLVGLVTFLAGCGAAVAFKYGYAGVLWANVLGTASGALIVGWMAMRPVRPAVPR